MRVEKITEPVDLDIRDKNLTPIDHEYSHFRIDKMPKYVFFDENEYVLHIRRKQHRLETFVVCSNSEPTKFEKLSAFSFLATCVEGQEVLISLPASWNIKNVFDSLFESYEKDFVREGPNGDEIQYEVVL